MSVPDCVERSPCSRTPCTTPAPVAGTRTSPCAGPYFTGSLDLAVSTFRGTSREPLLVPVTTKDGLALQPGDEIMRSSLDRCAVDRRGDLVEARGADPRRATATASSRPWRASSTRCSASALDPPISACWPNSCSTDATKRLRSPRSTTTCSSGRLGVQRHGRLVDPRRTGRRIRNGRSIRLFRGRAPLQRSVDRRARGEVVHEHRCDLDPSTA